MARQRIKVIWLNGTSWAFYDNTADAYDQCATLRMAGFSDAHIDWAASVQ